MNHFRGFATQNDKDLEAENCSDEDEDDIGVGTQEAKPSLFDILQDDADEDLEMEEDLSSEQQE